jgi:phosphatidylglycerophosphatase C
MNIAFFDFDGTVTTSDSFLPFIRGSVPQYRILAGTLYLSPLITGYRLGWVPARRMRESIAWFAFRGAARAKILEQGRRYAEQLLPGRVRPQAQERIEWHQAQGDTVVVVSASLDAYLVPWCRAQGVELICSELEVRGDTCTGRYIGGDCSGPEKARRILARYDLRQYRQVFAYGDTDEDREMLGLASHRYLRWRELSPSGPFAHPTA